MPIATPLHPRTRDLCSTYRWKDWSGYYAVCRYDSDLNREYEAFRNRAGLLDVSPLFKVRVRGRDAEAALNRMVPRDVTRCRVGQVLYTPWCDERGHVLDDGTLQRLGEREFRVTSALPSLRWLETVSAGLTVDLEDESEAIAALSLQGPLSRDVLLAAGAEPVRDLRFFRRTPARLGGVSVEISRTGYTGDLGFEIWMPQARAVDVWDRLLEAGGAYGITPAGLDALDVTRIEAGLILIDVDYYSARMTQVERRKSTPHEIGLGWCVSAKKTADYVGRAAIQREVVGGPARELVGLEIDTADLERRFEEEDLPLEIHEGACRDPLPVYDHGQQVGYASSSTWSPILKRPLALATLRAPYNQLGRTLQIETTVEYQRKRVSATVVKRPFFDPPRKRR